MSETSVVSESQYPPGVLASQFLSEESIHLQQYGPRGQGESSTRTEHPLKFIISKNLSSEFRRMVPEASNTPRLLRSDTSFILAEMELGKLLIEETSRVSLPESLLKSATAVVETLRLESGWNSFSAKPVLPGNAIAAIKLLGRLMDARTPIPLVVPRVNGSLQLEWHTRRVDIEIYINSPYSVSFYAEDYELDQLVEGDFPKQEGILKLWIEGLRK